MEIKGIGNDITSVYGSITSSEDQEAEFQKIIEEAMAKQDDKELMEACEEFEAYYVQQLFKEMRKTIPEGGLFEESNEEGIYEEMLDEEYSKVISKGSGTGIAEALYSQLSKDITKKD